MSRRVWIETENGRAYGRPRPIHAPEPEADDRSRKCNECGLSWYWVVNMNIAGEGARYRRHYPGTFWESNR